MPRPPTSRDGDLLLRPRVAATVERYSRKQRTRKPAPKRPDRGPSTMTRPAEAQARCYCGLAGATDRRPDPLSAANRMLCCTPDEPRRRTQDATAVSRGPPIGDRTHFLAQIGCYAVHSTIRGGANRTLLRPSRARTSPAPGRLSAFLVFVISERFQRFSSDFSRLLPRDHQEYRARK